MFRRDKAVALLVGSKYVSNGPPPLPSSKRKTEGLSPSKHAHSPPSLETGDGGGLPTTPDPLPRSKSETEGDICPYHVSTRQTTKTCHLSMFSMFGVCPPPPHLPNTEVMPTWACFRCSVCLQHLLTR